MSAARPGSGVSQTTGAPAARTTSSERLRVDRARVEVGVPVGARVERVARVVAVHQVDPAGDRLHPVDGVRRGRCRPSWRGRCRGRTRRRRHPGRSRRRSPPRAARSRRATRAIAPLPPAVFSMSIGSGRSICSMALTQFATPWAGSTSPVTCPPCTISPFAPMDAAAFSCWSSSFLLGMRIRLLVDRHVDHVRGVDVHVHIRRGVGVAQRAGITAGDDRPLPALRVTEEELRDPRAARHRVVQRVIGVEVPANTHHAP